MSMKGLAGLKTKKAIKKASPLMLLGTSTIFGKMGTCTVGKHNTTKTPFPTEKREKPSLE